MSPQSTVSNQIYLKVNNATEQKDEESIKNLKS
jgi:hypothetical protein